MALCLSAACVAVSCSRAPTLDAGPLLQDVGADRITVVWWQSRAGPATLKLRDQSGQQRSVPAEQQGSRFEAHITGLRPSTIYTYWVDCASRTDDELHISGHLRTAHLGDKPFSFLVFGDSGTGKSQQYSLARTMNRRPVAIALHTGDLVYPNGEFSDYPLKFFVPYRTLLGSTPFYPVLGNHDIRTDNGRPFLDAFSLPTNGPPGIASGRCYWFDYGLARFVAIDSNLDESTLSKTVAPWLRQALDQSPDTWRFVFLHHPPWTGARHAPDEKIRNTLVPTIEAGNTDIVFAGHNHLYERTHPIRGGQVSPTNGVIYITSGAAGGKPLHPEARPSAPWLAAFDDSSVSFTWVNVAGARLELVQTSADNRILDSLSIEKRPHAIPGVRARPPTR